MSKNNEASKTQYPESSFDKLRMTSSDKLEITSNDKLEITSSDKLGISASQVKQDSNVILSLSKDDSGHRVLDTLNNKDSEPKALEENQENAKISKEEIDQAFSHVRDDISQSVQNLKNLLNKAQETSKK